MASADAAGRGTRVGSGSPVLALENLRVELLQCDTASHVTPPLTLYAVVDAELLRTANRAPLHRERFEY